MSNLSGIRVTQNEEITYHPAEHEIFLSFHDDQGARAFSDWLTDAGWEAFIAWGKEHKEHGEYMREDFIDEEATHIKTLIAEGQQRLVDRLATERGGFWPNDPFEEIKNS